MGLETACYSDIFKGYVFPAFLLMARGFDFFVSLSGIASKLGHHVSSKALWSNDLRDDRIGEVTSRRPTHRATTGPTHELRALM